MIPILMKTNRIECAECGCKKANIYFEEKYSGYRGFCPICQTNWPES